MTDGEVWRLVFRALAAVGAMTVFSAALAAAFAWLAKRGLPK